MQAQLRHQVTAEELELGAVELGGCDAGWDSCRAGWLGLSSDWVVSIRCKTCKALVDVVAAVESCQGELSSP